MIELSRQDRGLKALNLVLVVARKMAHDRHDHERIVKVLDIAELLPELLRGRDDNTDAFRRYLEHLAEIEPMMKLPLDVFVSELELR